MRASSGPEIGLGHAARTLSVAEALVQDGAMPLVIVDEESTASFLRDAGVPAVVADSRGAWLDQPADAAWFDTFEDVTGPLTELGERGVPCVLVENRTPARELATKLVYPSLHHRDDAWDVAHPDRVCSGARWIPLRREVLNATAEERDVDWLVTFGGSDPFELTERVLAHLPCFVEPGERVAVVIGLHMASRAAAIAAAAAEVAEGRSIEVVQPGPELPSWMARSRRAVTAVATSINELAYQRVGTLLVANYAEDRDVLAYYDEHGPHVPAGVARELDDEEFARALELGGRRLRSVPPPLVEELGSGAGRLAQLLIQLPTVS